MSTNPLVAAAQSLVNRYLRFDTEFAEMLAPLAGRVVAVELTGAGIELEVTLEAGAVQVRVPRRPGGAQAQEAAAADVTIRGTPFALLRLAREGGDDVTAGGTVRVTGDIETAQRLARALSRVDPDFEEMLARVLGDAAARQVGRGVRGLRSLAYASARTMARDIGEFLTEESRLTPGVKELEAFAAGVETLRDDVARLEKRIERVEHGGRNRST